MCECRARLTLNLKNFFLDKNPAAENVAVNIEGYSMVMVGNSLKTVGSFGVSIDADITNAKGVSKRKKTKSVMHFTYCPFCGEKYIPDDAGAQEAKP
jgi:hypothetical protein